MNPNHTQAAPAAGADARPTLGYYLDEDTFHLLQRAAAAAELLAGIGEYAEMSGKPLQLNGPPVTALGDYMRNDLKAAMDACRWGVWTKGGAR